MLSELDRVDLKQSRTNGAEGRQCDAETWREVVEKSDGEEGPKTCEGSKRRRAWVPPAWGEVAVGGRQVEKMDELRQEPQGTVLRRMIRFVKLRQLAVERGARSRRKRDATTGAGGKDRRRRDLE